MNSRKFSQKYHRQEVRVRNWGRIGEEENELKGEIVSNLHIATLIGNPLRSEEGGRKKSYKEIVTGRRR